MKKELFQNKFDNSTFWTDGMRSLILSEEGILYQWSFEEGEWLICKREKFPSKRGYTNSTADLYSEV